MKRILLLLSCLSSAMMAIAAPATPVITNATGMTKFSWVLIHAPVSFLVPGRTPSADGTASFQWNAVAGATNYQVRLFVNGVWGNWISVGSVNASSCTLNSFRTVTGNCSVSVDCG